MTLTLTTLRTLLLHARFHGALGDSHTLDAFTADSRAAQAGTLFIATRGVSHDGHAFIADALARGSRAVVAEIPAPAELSEGVLWVQTPDTAIALAEIAAEYYGHPGDQLKVLATTGTNGKTTTSFVLQAILAHAGQQCGLMSTVRVDTGRALLPTIFTTPPAPDFHRLLREMLDAGCAFAAVEASSHGLHQRRIAALRVAVAGFTNLSRDHLDYHGTMADYADAKRILFQELADRAAIAVDDPTGLAFAAAFRATGRDMLAISTSQPPTPGADVYLSGMSFDLQGCRAQVHLPDGRALPLETRLVGAHNLQNALLATVMAHLAGLSWDTALAGLAVAPGAPGRLERVEAPSDGLPTVFVDYAHTPDALARVLETLGESLKTNHSAGRLICVFGAGGDRDRGKRPEMGAAAATGADRVVVTSDNPRTEDPAAIINDIMSGIPDAQAVTVLADRRVAIYQAIADAAPEDVVIVAGKGHEDYQIIGTERFAFDDRLVAYDALVARTQRLAVTA